MYLTFQNAKHLRQMLFHHPFPWLLCCCGFFGTRCYEVVNVASVHCNATTLTNCSVMASKDCSKKFMEDYSETFIIHGYRDKDEMKVMMAFPWKP
jgi:hypothetical protein